MNKKNAKQIQKQLEVVNDRIEALITKWNKDFDRNMQELLQLSTLLQNVEEGHLETNDLLLK
jgi:CRISPR/Cas system CMR-associated protein Cmr5 small subunit